MGRRYMGLRLYVCVEGRDEEEGTNRCSSASVSTSPVLEAICWRLVLYCSYCCCSSIVPQEIISPCFCFDLNLELFSCSGWLEEMGGAYLVASAGKLVVPS